MPTEMRMKLLEASSDDGKMPKLRSGAYKNERDIQLNILTIRWTIALIS